MAAPRGGGAAAAAAARRRAAVQAVSTKVGAFLWVVAAAATLHYSQLWHTLTSDPDVNRCDRDVATLQPFSPCSRVIDDQPPFPSQHRTYLLLAMVCLGVIVVMIAYMTLYLPYVKKLDLNKTSWNAYNSRLIPTTAAFMAAFTFTFMFALWPVYGLLTPVLQMVLFLGFIQLSHFLPAW